MQVTNLPPSCQTPQSPASKNRRRVVVHRNPLLFLSGMGRGIPRRPAGCFGQGVGEKGGGINFIRLVSLWGQWVMIGMVMAAPTGFAVRQNMFFFPSQAPPSEGTSPLCLTTDETDPRVCCRFIVVHDHVMATNVREKRGDIPPLPDD